ncbi:MAG TPA: DUF2273 domain-containing protein [Bacilli bacterium]
MWHELWYKYKGTLTGTACGFILGIVYLFFGFWDMVVFAFIVLVGFYLGSKLDHPKNLTGNVPNVYKWLADRWKMFR